jgi:16S rRNA (guanine527-N7)-methyltransferase
MSLEPVLRAGAQQMGVVLHEQACQKLLNYLALMQKWNRVYNLSAIRDPQEMMVKHLLDSLAVVPHLSNQALSSLIDVGTGGGLPGIPIAIVFPDLAVSLLDSNEKKTRFLVQVKAQLGLENVKVLHQRVEDHSQRYDVVISRAFASMQDFIELTKHLVTDKGCWLAMKSQSLPEELSHLPQGYQVESLHALTVPGLNAERNLVKIRKQGTR